MRLTELCGARVRTRDGRRCGRVREVHCSGGEVTHLSLGAAGWAERLTGRPGRRLAWSSVVAVDHGEIVVEP